MTEPDSAVDTEVSQDANDRSGQRRRRTSRMVILVVFLLVVGPIVWREAPREVARWYVAGAQVRYDRQDFEGAKQRIETALQWDAASVSALEKRAQWSLGEGSYRQAAEDLSRAIELQPDNVSLYQQRTHVYLKLGEFQKAIEDGQRLQRMFGPRNPVQRASALNNLAYARAVANVELEEALKNIELALKLVPPNAAFLDTRGFVHFQLGNDQQALEDLDEAVRRVESKWEQSVSVWGTPEQAERSSPERARHLHQLAEGVAVIRYHRGLVHERLGNTEQADADFARVRQLGFEPNEDLF